MLHPMPDLPADCLPRPRLLAPLLGARSRLRLFCAPAGSGKSLLLRACAQHLPAGTELCWLDLRGPRGDATPLQRLAVALGLGDTSEQALESYLAQRERPLWIMLDHFCCAAAPALDAAFGQLLQSASPRVCWWVASRRRPAWSLTRLLLAGDLQEVDGRQLALTDTELQTLLQGQAAPHQAIDADELMRRTGGWFAGVKLQLLAGGLGETTLGCERMLRDYLEGELLARLPERQREILCLLACLPDFDARLAEPFMEPGEGAAALSALLNAGAFIEPLSRGCQRWRVHPAVASALAANLPASRQRWLYCQMSQHFAASGDIVLAVRHALLAGQAETAISLMARLGVEALLAGEGPAQVLRWREQLPAELLNGAPELVLLQTWALLLGGRLEGAQACLTQLASHLPSPCARRQTELLGHWQALRGQLLQRNGLADEAAQALTQALQALPERAWVERAMTHLALLEQAHANGRRDEARQLGAALAKRIRERECLPLEALLMLQHAGQLEERGELARAEGVLRRTLAELAPIGGAVQGRAHLQLAGNLWRQGRPHDARGHYTLSLELCSWAADPAAARARIGLAELDAASGDLTAAHAGLAEVLRSMQLQRVSEVLYRPQLDLLRARLWLREGRHGDCAELAAGHLQAYRERPGLEAWHSFELLHLRAGLASGQDCAERLEAWRQRALRNGLPLQACELGFALAEAHLVGARQRKAQAALFDAQALARRYGGLGCEGYWHSFRPELARWARKLETGGDETVDASQLSRRERSVLNMIAEGLANQEIAERLHISLHTVKSHAQRINSKLGVSRRTQAIVRAKALGLVT